MLISRKHKFIFIHIYKNAGSSIRDALISYAASRLQRKFTGVLSKVNIKIPALLHQPLDAHVRASDVIDYMGLENFRKYFSFAFIRNPWDWQVSQYKYMLKTPEHFQHDTIKKLKTFEDYIHWRCTEDVVFQKDYIYAENGELLVDFVGRFEDIDQDFQNICTRIGISANLPKINVSNTRPYQEFYNSETREMIRKTFEPDIALFNYEFE